MATVSPQAGVRLLANVPFLCHRPVTDTHTHTRDNVKQRSPDNFTMPGQINEQFSIPKFSTQAIPRAGGGAETRHTGQEKTGTGDPRGVCVCVFVFVPGQLGEFHPYKQYTLSSVL